MITEMSHTLTMQLNLLAMLQERLDPQMLETVTLQKGQTLFIQGEESNAYYVVESGNIEIQTDGIVVDHIVANMGFGELSLLNLQRRTGTATALEASQLVRITKHEFLSLLDVEDELSEYLRQRGITYLRRSMLAKSLQYLIGTVDVETLHTLENQIIWKNFQAGEVIYEQGTLGTDMALIISGRVRSTYDDGLKERVLGYASSNEVMGELALISHAERMATVTAVRETLVACITSDVFESLMQDSPTFARRVMSVIVERQKMNVNPHHVNKLKGVNYAIVPTQDDLQLESFIHELFPHLEKHSTSLFFTSTDLDAHFEVQDAITNVPKSFIREYFIGLEQRYDFLFLQVDSTNTEWTQWVVHNADRVLLVGNAGNRHTPNELEQAIIEQNPHHRYELVLLHKPDTHAPSGTKKWLDARTVERHHHIRLDDTSHFARLGRLLTGNGIGWVFGGGGARGYAYVGIIKALMEEQIPVDAIGCVSMGAIVGGGLFDSINHENPYDMLVYKTKTYGSKDSLFDATIPITAIMRSHKVSHATRGIVSDRDIEDGWISFYCVSTNMSKADIHIHRDGPINKAVRASLSLPGVFTPVVRDGDLMVDGGVMNNFPVDIMREHLEGGTVIGMLVSSDGNTKPYEIEDHVDGTKALFSRFLPWMKKQRVPSIVRTILSATSVNSYKRLNEWRREVDFLIETNTTPYGTLDFDASEDLIEIGYNTHKETISLWKNDNQQLFNNVVTWESMRLNG